MSSKSEKYYWLKLRKGYFATRAIKKMRQCEHGETMTIIYLKLQLEALETDGVISLGGFGDTPEEELSLLIDEEPAPIKQTLDFLVKYKMAFLSEGEVCLPEVITNTGSETSSAERMRKLRAKENSQISQECNNVQKCDGDVRKSDIEKEIEKERELEKEIEQESTSSQSDAEVQAPSHQKEFNLEFAWNETLKVYPRKANVGDAYETWLTRVQAKEGQEKATCTAIFNAIQRYKADYIEKNQDDTEFKFVPGFGKWLKTELNQWISN